MSEILTTIRSAIVELSGSGKRVMPNARRHGIYSSFTLEGLEMQAVRDTRQRFQDFGIDEDLSGKTLLDVGCNVGAMIFEAARRGARVTGVEYRDDRVALCRMIAKHYRLSAEFYQHDLNGGPIPETWMGRYDVVLCCSVDEYVNDLETFYEDLAELCDDVLYFECNRQGGVPLEVMEACLTRAGFRDVKYLGNGHSGGISRKRKLFRARSPWAE